MYRAPAQRHITHCTGARYRAILLTVLGPRTGPCHLLYWAPVRGHNTHCTGPRYRGPSTVSNRPIAPTVLGPSTRPYYALYWAPVQGDFTHCIGPHAQAHQYRAILHTVLGSSHGIATQTLELLSIWSSASRSSISQRPCDRPILRRRNRCAAIRLCDGSNFLLRTVVPGKLCSILACQTLELTAHSADGSVAELHKRCPPCPPANGAAQQSHARAQ